MLARRIARTALSLVIAYAIALGGVLTPALGHGFDPDQQLCALGNDALSGDPVPDGSKPGGAHDCCPGLCGAQPAVIPLAAQSDPKALHSAEVAAHPATASLRSGVLRAGCARAPPAA